MAKQGIQVKVAVSPLMVAEKAVMVPEADQAVTAALAVMAAAVLVEPFYSPHHFFPA